MGGLFKGGEKGDFKRGGGWRRRGRETGEKKKRGVRVDVKSVVG